MSANEEADIRNFDLRSFYQQFECAVYTNDPAFMSDVLQDFEKTFEYSELVVESNRERRSVFNRAFAGILQLFAPFM